MKQKATTLLLLFSIFFTIKTFASDSTHRKTPLLISISGGLTSNTVHGSMVDRNTEFSYGHNTEQQNKIGFILNLRIKKKLSDFYFLKYGVSIIQKNVNPMVNSYSLYLDTLKTAYLSAPFMAGINFLPSGSFINLSLAFGPSLSFVVNDKSTSGPDRVGFSTSGLNVSLCTEATLSFPATSKARFFIQYNNIYDITNSYVETLYWSNAEPNKKFVYKYITNSLSLGFQWPIK
jgi:hypothetical protein